MKYPGAVLSSLLFLVACTSTVSPGTSSTSASGSGGATATVNASAGTGGGNIGLGGFPGSGTGGAFACKEAAAAYFVDVNGDGGAQHLTSGCTQTMAWGYFFEAPAGGGGLEVYGCLQGSPVKVDLNAGIMMTGTDTTVVLQYTDAAGNAWHAPLPGSMTITAYGAAGEAIDGTFAVDVTADASSPDAGGAPLSLTGSFHVCHRPDLIAP